MSNNSNAILSFSDKWTQTDRFNVACLCAYTLYELWWSRGYSDKLFKQHFLNAIFIHLDIHDIKEQTLIQRIPYEHTDSNSHAIRHLVNDFKSSSNDIREQIIVDLLLVSLGLSQKLLKHAENSKSRMRQGLKQGIKSTTNTVANFLKSTDTHSANLTESTATNSSSDESSILSSSSRSDDSAISTINPATYDARSRAVLFRLARHLELSSSLIPNLEKSIAQQLYFMQQEASKPESSVGKETKETDIHKDMHASASENLEKREKKMNRLKWFATGAGVVVGATVIGLTGGLAAPLVAAGIGAVTSVAGVSFVATASTVALITSLFGIAGGGLGGYKMHKRMGSLKVFEFTQMTPDPCLPQIPSLTVTIAITGYLLESTDEITKPWLPFFSRMQRDAFALTFEPEILLDLGVAFRRFIAQQAVKVVASQALQYTVFAALTTALMLPAGLMKAGDLIDNPWALGVDRAGKAGLVLADVLCERVQGKRPVVLVGYSLGALVIWNCLLELSRRQMYGLVDSVVLIGAPIPSTSEQWSLACPTVSRRVINAYATNDVVLAVVYRMHSLDLKVAGLEAVAHDSVENYDVTKLTKGHLDYKEPNTLKNILEEVGIE
ncbi:8354_t:CDS:2 [Paraglomus occultum]|uniref:8354_t:CDS:1 n=1 Tax=Paraglomus occultum TaxID=144539 RepID=A0A9N9G3F8_9GLOM|nr:8354_t:CDS:2 [Paraglomus occultum]